MQKYAKGRAGERFDFYMQYDVATQDPEQMLERVKTIGQITGTMDKNGVVDTEQLLAMAIGQVMPGAAEKVILPKETATQRAMEEERQLISELVAAVPPNVRENDAHELKLQIFQEWLSQPDVAEKVQQDQALQERVKGYLQQRQFAIQQKLNATIGRLGAAPTQFGQTASAA